ncbi:NADH-ubiquinone oxidoreductase 49kDa subunit [Acetobacter aceti NRIC 0242]|uniref:Hydrogenase expression protein HypE n=1 Tax=Acetobacter aceti NBRC 14818 TaxID=887700 RepID=A0AB33IKB0_ACEAC|nr:NADH-ubiquinone oxidoreductase [Acetobacter aceti]TCS33355.1 Ni,Fe-hydrogenase III large subunit [Acetobacter aceti NBRC 14818]BCK77522.1 hydrogenase expression protein HypE [Acetobacter aceti NBRC 14818]GAN56839.1 NADH-ubiquinone oxidoreductase 49kDa subunit [Acetobacter aceti NBRC 14818]GBO80452.1 NADH-ubiquinone oxidoreductase 49kDa subunit [Acetobacter aceti NRIC 0242]
MSIPPILFGGGALVTQEPSKPTVRTLIRNGQKTETAWRFELTEDTWFDLVECLRDDPAVLLGLWCDGKAVHAFFNDGVPGGEVGLRPLMASLVLDGPRYRGFSAIRHRAAPFERMIRDLWGVEAMDAADTRPLVDRGAWAVTAPLSERPVPASGMTDMLEFSTPDPVVAAQGMVFSRGPASGGSEGAVHFRLGVANGRVRTVEALTGFAHRGMEARMAGVSLADAAALSGRIHVGATLAHQWVFSAAVEQAMGVTVAPMIGHIRAMLCEIERIYTHLTSLARTADAAGAEMLATRLYKARDILSRVCQAAIGRRLLLDCVVPGGVTLAISGHEQLHEDVVLEGLRTLCEEIAVFGTGDFLDIQTLWQATGVVTSGLVGEGVVPRDQADALVLGGAIGRSCGRGADLRQSMEAYSGVRIRTPVAIEGDAAARCRIRFEDIAESLRMIAAFGAMFTPDDEAERPSFLGPLKIPQERSEGYAAVEGPDGLICHVVILQAGRVERTFIAEPAGVLQGVQETALQGSSPSKFDAVRCSFGVSVAAVDL